MCEGYVSRLVALWSFVMPRVRHICMLLPFAMLNVNYAQLVPIWVILKGKVTQIWFFSYHFAYAITSGCAGFKLSFGTIIVL